MGRRMTVATEVAHIIHQFGCDRSHLLDSAESVQHRAGRNSDEAVAAPAAGFKMHEISLMESVVGLIEDERCRQDFSRVRTIRLRVGMLGHAEPDALRFCFRAVAEGTIAEGAQLEIHMVPGAGRCDQCDVAVPLDERFASCAICGSPIRLTAGDDVKLAELEVD